MIQDHPWVWHWSGMWIFPMVIFTLMIIFMFIFIGRRGCRPPWWYSERHYDKTEGTDSALEILKKRYAKGEITKEEFEEMKKSILD